MPPDSKTSLAVTGVDDKDTTGARSTAFVSLSGTGTVIYPNEPSLRVSVRIGHASLPALNHLVYITDSIIPDDTASSCSQHAESTALPPHIGSDVIPRNTGYDSDDQDPAETSSLGDLAHVDRNLDSSRISDHASDLHPSVSVISNEDSDGEGEWGCDCTGDYDECDSSRCDCVATFGHFYTSQPSGVGSAPGAGVLNLDALPPKLPLVECGASCPCDEGCKNRVTQRGLRVPIHVQPLDTISIGLGAFYSPDTPRALSKGTFICLYAGEYLSTAEANRRWTLASTSTQGEGQGNYILTLRLPGQRIHIDPRHKGNAGRFFNHSCDPNCVVHVVRWGGSNTWPRAAIFAKRDIQAEEELTYDYADASGDGSSIKLDDDQLRGTTPCLCGSRICRGWMPFDPDL